MGLSVNTIITLENNEQYVVLNESLYDGSKYFMVMGMDNNKDIIPTKVKIVKEEVVGLDTFIIIIKDTKMIAKLTKILKEQV